MILFFARGEVDSDKYILHCYGYYRSIMHSGDVELPKQVKILREDGKKPRFDTDLVHFSLSHSHGVILLAMSHSPIGADIELVREVDLSRYPFIEAADMDEFFRKWTERESYVKLTGEGLGGIRKDIPEDAHFEHFDVFDGYHAAVCAEEQNIIAYEMDLNEVE